MADFLLLSRPECHLCEAFYDELVTAFPTMAARTAWATVDEREDWQRRFGLRIPVMISSAGEVVCAERFDAQAIADWLQDETR